MDHHLRHIGFRIRGKGIPVAMLLCLGFLLLTSTTCLGQQLHLKIGKYRTAVYEPGDTISFRLHDEKFSVTDRIIGFGDSNIIFPGYEIHPGRISHVYVDGKIRSLYLLKYKYKKIFLISGSGYLALDWINNGDVPRETYVVSGVLVGAGLLAMLLIDNKIKVKGNRTLSITTTHQPIN
jgi:hypothetical protein